MSGEKYIGLDVHQATISVAVMDSQGKLIMESILETKASTILEFLAGLRGTLSVTFEEGTWAAWLYDLLKPHVANLVVCNPRKIALLKHGNKSDKIWPPRLNNPVSYNSRTIQENNAQRAFADFGEESAVFPPGHRADPGRAVFARKRSTRGLRRKAPEFCFPFIDL